MSVLATVIGRYNDADQVRLSLARCYIIRETNHASSEQLGSDLPEGNRHCTTVHEKLGLRRFAAL
jgi:hypothetical protein